MESIILTAKVTGIEQSIIAGARSAEKALVFRPKIDASGFTKLSGPLGRLNSQATEFNKSLEASNARVLAFGASAGAIFALQRGLQAVVRDAIEVEKVLADINSVLNQTTKGLAKFTDDIFDAAKNAGTSFKVASEAALELSRQGLSAEATTKRLNAALVLARLGGLDAKEAVEGLTAAINSFSNEALDDVDVVNRLANVAAKFAVSEKDLTEALKRSASAASDAGVSFNELVALVTSAQQTTARGGAVIGNALKTIFTRLQRSDTLEQLESLGVAVRDVNNELLSAPQILRNLSSIYNDLGKEQKNFISELVGGVFQINQLKAQLNDLSKDYGFYARSLEVASDVTSTAIQRNEELNKTTAASLNAIGVSITKLSAIAGGEILKPLFQNIEGLSKFFLDTLSPETGEEAGKGIGTGILKGIGSALSGPGLLLAGAGLFALFVRLGSFAKEAGKSILDNVRGIERQRQVQAEVESLLAQSGKSYADIVRGATSLEQVEKRILAIVREQLALRTSASSLTANLSPGIASGGGFGFGQSKLSSAGLGFSAGKLYTTNPKVPGFADPIREAINREKAAGVPASSIYIDRDPRVKSPSNPLGILVANRRDEPMGGYQGVNRAISLGMDPKKGTGNGYIPNFVSASPGSEFRVFTGRGKESRFISTSQAQAINAAIKLYEEGLNSASQGLKTQAKELKGAAVTILKSINLTSDYNKILDRVVVDYKQDINSKVFAYDSPIGPRPQGIVVRNGGTKKASEAAFLATQAQFSGSVGQPGSLLKYNNPALFDGTNQFTGFKAQKFLRETLLESKTNNLFDLSNSNLGSLSGGSPFSIKNGSDKAAAVLQLRKEFNKYRTNPLQKSGQLTGFGGDFIKRVESLSKQDTIQEQFKKTVQESIEGGKTFNEAVTQAANEFAKRGGSSKQLSEVILKNARSFTDLENNVEKEKVERRNGIAEIVKRNSAENALTRENGALQKLSKEQKSVIRSRLREEAKKSLGFGGVSDADLASNPEALRQVNRTAALAAAQMKNQASEIKKQLANELSNKKFDPILSSTFSKRESGLAGIFGSQTGDIANLRANLGFKKGDKLNPQQQIALENRLQQTRQLRSGRLTTAGIGASFGASALAGSGLIGNGLGAGITQGAATGLSFGSFFGPYGMAAGAVAGGALGAAGALREEPQKQFQKAAEAYKQLSAELENGTNNAQQYANVQAQLSDLIKSGVAKESDISNLNGKLTDLFNSIGDNETRKKILSAGGNIDLLNKAIADLANKNATKLAKESIKVAETFAKSNSAGGLLSGKSFKYEDLTKLGQAIASTTNLTAEELTSLEERLARVAKGGSFGEVNALLGKFGYDITGLSLEVEDALTTLTSAVQSSKFRREIEQTNKDLVNYESKLVEFNKSFSSLVSSLLEQSRLRELQSSSDREVGLSRFEGNLQLASGGSTEISLINNQALLAKARLQASFADDNAGLTKSVQDNIRGFVEKNLNTTEKKNFQQRIAGGFDPIVELKNLVSLNQDSFNNGRDSFNELQEIASSADSGFTSLAITQNKSIALLEQQNQLTKELARRRDLGSIFGGAGGLGQNLDTSAIYEGARAGAAIRSKSRFLSQGDISSQITEARGLIEQSNLFPGSIDAFRTSENRGRVEEANKSDIINKNRQILAASLKGIFEGEFKAGGAFGPGGDVTGGDLQRRLYSALTLDRTKGGTDYSEAQKILETSTLGIRNPKTLARLKGAVGSAAQVAGFADESATEKAKNQFATPVELQDKFIKDLAGELKGKQVADNTRKTVEEIQRLKGIFEKQIPLAQKIEEIKRSETGINNQSVAVGSAQRARSDFFASLNLGKQELTTTTYRPFSGSETTAGAGFIDSASRFSNGKVTGADKGLREIAEAIGQGGTIEEITKRAKEAGGSNFNAFTNKLANGGDPSEAFNKFLLEFAGDDKKKSFADLSEQVKLAENSLNELKNSSETLSKQMKIMESDFASYIKNQSTSSPGINVPDAPIVFRGATSLSGEARNSVIDNFVSVENRTAQANTSLRSAASGYGDRDMANTLLNKKQKAETDAASAIKAASKEGGLAFAASISKGFEEAIKGASDKTKVEIENKVNSSIEIVVKDGRLTQEEITQLKEGYEKLAKEVFELNNKDKQGKGLNTSPTVNPSASGARR